MDLSSQADYLSVVPDEIWVEIFKQSSAEDRKNIRLTCRRFNELCEDSTIPADEVIAMYGCIDAVSAVRCFSGITRKVRNVKLCSVPVQIDVLPLFEKQGIHVQSLHFQNCSFNAGALKTIIKHCPSLRSFTLNFEDGIEFEQMNALNDFEDLATSSIVRDKVTDFSLSLESEAGEFTNRKFRSFFTVFPNIKMLDLRISGSVLETAEFYSTEPSLVSNWTFTYPCIYDRLLVLADQLQILRLCFDTYLFEPVVANCNISTIEMKNLKELSLNWWRIVPGIALLHSSLFKHLTHFSCTICDGPQTPQDVAPVSAFLQYLLRHSPLRYLNMTSYAIRFDRELFQALVKSELRTLILLIQYNTRVTLGPLPMAAVINFEPAALESTLMPNYSLQYMSFGKSLEWDVVLLFAICFRSLRHLDFPRVDGPVLQNIFKQQTNIRSLRLRNGTREKFHCLRKWLRQEASINRQVEHLVQLVISEDARRFPLTCFLLGEFVFPNLKWLKIDLRFCRPVDLDQLWQLIGKLPELRSLWLELPATITFAQCLALFESLSKLRHFCLADYRSADSLFTRAMYEQLFASLPSLRTIAHKFGGNYFVYAYDVIRNTVVNTADLCSCPHESSSTYVEDRFKIRLFCGDEIPEV